MELESNTLEFIQPPMDGFHNMDVSLPDLARDMTVKRIRGGVLVSGRTKKYLPWFRSMMRDNIRCLNLDLSGRPGAVWRKEVLSWYIPFEVFPHWLTDAGSFLRGDTCGQCTFSGTPDDCTGCGSLGIENTYPASPINISRKRGREHTDTVQRKEPKVSPHNPRPAMTLVQKFLTPAHSK